jgi:hypothetical protein
LEAPISFEFFSNIFPASNDIATLFNICIAIVLQSILSRFRRLSITQWRPRSFKGPLGMPTWDQAGGVGWLDDSHIWQLFNGCQAPFSQMPYISWTLLVYFSEICTHVDGTVAYDMGFHQGDFPASLGSKHCEG